MLMAVSTTGETIEGFFLHYSEGYEPYNIIVTYDGSIYFSDSHPAGTALYGKIYDTKKGWLLDD